MFASFLVDANRVLRVAPGAMTDRYPHGTCPSTFVVNRVPATREGIAAEEDPVSP
jgi:hypothetical protein